MLMSFLLTERSLSRQGLTYIRRRLGRLLTPHVVWTLMPALIYVVLYRCFHIQLANVRSLSTVGLQLLTGGTTINNVMWYMVDMIALTCIAAALYSIVKSDTGRIYAIILLLIGAIYLQYSGRNYWMFYALSGEVRPAVGRLLEMMPYMCIGLLISRSGLLEKAKEHWLGVAIIAGIMYFISKRLMFFTSPMTSSEMEEAIVAGFAYEGLYKLYKAILLVVIFYVVPLNKLSKWIKAPILFLSDYSVGIYCMHRLVGRVLNDAKNGLFLKLGWPTYSFLGVFINFGICLLLSFAISKIPGKWPKRAVM